MQQQNRDAERIATGFPIQEMPVADGQPAAAIDIDGGKERGLDHVSRGDARVICITVIAATLAVGTSREQQRLDHHQQDTLRFDQIADVDEIQCLQADSVDRDQWTVQAQLVV